MFFIWEDRGGEELLLISSHYVIREMCLKACCLIKAFIILPIIILKSLVLKGLE